MDINLITNFFMWLSILNVTVIILFYALLYFAFDFVYMPYKKIYIGSKEDFNKGRSKSLKLAEYYDATRTLSKRLTEWSKNLNQEDQKYVICSGGGPGIMVAANRGAREAEGKTTAFRISLPFESRPNPYVSPELDFEFHYFFTRKF